MTGKQKDKCFAEWENLSSAAVEAAPKITTMAMNYDLGRETLRDLYDPMCDYVRYRELELLIGNDLHAECTGSRCRGGCGYGTDECCAQPSVS